MGKRPPTGRVCFLAERGLTSPLDTGSSTGSRGRIIGHGSAERLIGSPALCLGRESGTRLLGHAPESRDLRTVIIAPMTTEERPYPTRVALTFQGKRGQVALDQLRAIDRQRLVRKLGRISPKTAASISAVLVEMFARQKT